MCVGRWPCRGNAAPAQASGPGSRCRCCCACVLVVVPAPPSRRPRRVWGHRRQGGEAASACMQRMVRRTWRHTYLRLRLGVLVSLFVIKEEAVVPARGGGGSGAAGMEIMKKSRGKELTGLNLEESQPSDTDHMEYIMKLIFPQG